MSACVESQACLRCEIQVPLADYPPERKAKTGRSGVCRQCRNALRRASRARRHEPRPFREYSKKLPAYEELKRLYLGTATKRGLSYKEIGDRYGMGRIAVMRTLRMRAERRGEWPLLTPEQQRRRWRQGARMFWDGCTVNPSLIVLMIAEQADELGITQRDWCERAGVTWKWFLEVRSGRYRTIGVPGAIRLLRGLDEPVPSWMLDAAERLGVSLPAA